MNALPIAALRGGSPRTRTVIAKLKRLVPCQIRPATHFPCARDQVDVGGFRVLRLIVDVDGTDTRRCSQHCGVTTAGFEPATFTVSR